MNAPIRKPTVAQANDFGLTQIGQWTDYQSSPPLDEQLTQRGIEFDRADIPHLVGMGGCAYLIFYCSPNSGKPVTVLCVPVRADIDSFYEDYWYFEGMSREQALADEQIWLTRYDLCRALLAAS